MNFKIIHVEKNQQVLIQRDYDENRDVLVRLQTYPVYDYEHDEIVEFDNEEAASHFVDDYSMESALAFAKRAQDALVESRGDQDE